MSTVNKSEAPKRGTAPMIVVFGRAGAGKTTIADAVIRLLSTKEELLHCVGLDLDVCVTQWMRENFSNRIYPTLQEREEFATRACDYVDTELLKWSALLKESQTMVVVVSFSFVNTDLRDIFRSRFPNAVWALVDTTESEAEERVNQREGHFYKGAPPPKEKGESGESHRDNSEWNFAPVAFPHAVLPGKDPVEVNAQKVANTILKEYKDDRYHKV